MPLHDKEIREPLFDFLEDTVRIVIKDLITTRG